MKAKRLNENQLTAYVINPMRFHDDGASISTERSHFKLNEKSKESKKSAALRPVNVEIKNFTLEPY